jgi:hypothetical protein
LLSLFAAFFAAFFAFLAAFRTSFVFLDIRCGPPDVARATKNALIFWFFRDVNLIMMATALAINRKEELVALLGSRLLWAYLLAIALIFSPVAYEIYAASLQSSRPAGTSSGGSAGVVFVDSGGSNGTSINGGTLIVPRGVPGPIAGAGLPVLAVGYGVYWLVRRRRRGIGASQG